MGFYKFINVFNIVQPEELFEPFAFFNHVGDELMGIFVCAIIEVGFNVERFVLLLERFSFDDKFSLARTITF